MVAATQAATRSTREGRDALLRRALVGDAGFCAVMGILMIAGSGWIGEFTGLSPGWVPAAVGAGVLLWAADVGWLARKQPLDLRAVKFVIGGDIAWVVVSYAMLMTGVLNLTTAGTWTVGILAEMVALFAIAKYLGLRRIQTSI